MFLAFATLLAFCLAFIFILFVVRCFCVDVGMRWGVFWLIWAALVPWPWVGSVCMSVRSVSSDRYEAHRARAWNAVNRAGTRVGHAGCAGERRKYTFLSRGWPTWVGYRPTLRRKKPLEGAAPCGAATPLRKLRWAVFRETREEIMFCRERCKDGGESQHLP